MKFDFNEQTSQFFDRRAENSYDPNVILRVLGESYTSFGRAFCKVLTITDYVLFNQQIFPPCVLHTRRKIEKSNRRDLRLFY